MCLWLLIRLFRFFYPQSGAALALDDMMLAWSIRHNQLAYVSISIAPSQLNYSTYPANAVPDRTANKSYFHFQLMCWLFFSVNHLVHELCRPDPRWHFKKVSSSPCVKKWKWKWKSEPSDGINPAASSGPAPSPDMKKRCEQRRVKSFTNKQPNSSDSPAGLI